MSRIYVEFAGLKEVGQECKEISSRLDTINSDFRHMVRSLDWDVRFREDIDHKADQIAAKMQRYSDALKDYQNFVTDACAAYEKLDSYSNKTNRMDSSSKGVDASNPSFWEAFKKRFGYKDVLGSFGNAGKLYKKTDALLSADSWAGWAKSGIGAAGVLFNVYKDAKKYEKIGRAIGGKTAAANFLKKELGLKAAGYASKASNPVSRFFNNLHNKTSPYSFEKTLEPLTGAKGAGKTLLAWGEIAATGVLNAFDNIEEQKQSGGTMSNERVLAETVSETLIDTAAAYAGKALIGAAITAATGSVAAPVVVAAASCVAVAGINAGVEALTGKSATEWISDTVLNIAEGAGNELVNGAQAAGEWAWNTVTDVGKNIGDGISNGADAVVKWFDGMKFAW